MTSGENSLDRSSTVRSRRMQRRAGKAAQSRNKAPHGRNVPAMVARNPKMEQHLNQGRNDIRRRYPLKLATEGAELHLPALPVLRFGWRAVSAVLLGILLFSLYLALTLPIFTIGRVELAGAQRLDAQDVNAVLKLSGSSVFSLQPAIMKNAISEAFPELADFAIHIRLPARVVVDVLERQPAIAWEQSGITVWVDTAGMAFIPEGEAQNLITVQASEAPPSLEADSDSRHQLILPEMATVILALSEHTPEEAVLLFDPKLGFGWEDPGGWLAYFGSGAEDIDQRISVYQTIVAEMTDRGLKPTLISVAQLHAPYYRMDY